MDDSSSASWPVSSRHDRPPSPACKKTSKPAKRRSISRVNAGFEQWHGTKLSVMSGMFPHCDCVERNRVPPYLQSPQKQPSFADVRLCVSLIPDTGPITRDCRLTWLAREGHPATVGCKYPKRGILSRISFHAGDHSQIEQRDGRTSEHSKMTVCDVRLGECTAGL
jgi:hypothetical protein